MNYKSQAFVLASDDTQTLLRKPKDNRIGGIVTGIIISAFVFPLLVGAMILGIWMLYSAATEEAPLIIIIMGIVFAVGGCGLLRLFTGSLMAFFPFYWRMRRVPNDLWELNKYVAGVRVFSKLCGSWSLKCLPSYSRGDWGHFFTLRCDNSQIRLTPPAVFRSSKSAARRLAEKDTEVLQAHFGIECEMCDWK